MVKLCLQYIKDSMHLINSLLVLHVYSMLHVYSPFDYCSLIKLWVLPLTHLCTLLILCFLKTSKLYCINDQRYHKGCIHHLNYYLSPSTTISIFTSNIINTDSTLVPLMAPMASYHCISSTHTHITHTSPHTFIHINGQDWFYGNNGTIAMTLKYFPINTVPIIDIYERRASKTPTAQDNLHTTCVLHDLHQRNKIIQPYTPLSCIQ
jgi:hypothetical protein